MLSGTCRSGNPEFKKFVRGPPLLQRLLHISCFAGLRSLLRSTLSLHHQHHFAEGHVPWAAFQSHMISQGSRLDHQIQNGSRFKVSLHIDKQVLQSSGACLQIPADTLVDLRRQLLDWACSDTGCGNAQGKKPSCSKTAMMWLFARAYLERCCYVSTY